MRIYTFNHFLRERFGERVHKLSLNAGVGCPNKDGTLSDKGCIFCDENASTFFKDNELSLDEQIERAIETAQKRFKSRKFIAYFQAGSTTRVSARALEDLFATLKPFKEIVGLFISTRPDCLNGETVGVIDRYCDDYLVAIELGMQTANDQTLRFLNRNHTHRDVVRASKLIKDYPRILIAVHLILGIPGESFDDYDLTLDQVNELGIAGVKFHLFHILKNTPAEKLFRENKIGVLSKSEYMDALIYCLERLRKDIFIERLISTAVPECLVSPLWMNERQRFLQCLEQEMETRNTFQGKCFEDSPVQRANSLTRECATS